MVYEIIYTDLISVNGVHTCGFVHLFEIGPNFIWPY